MGAAKDISLEACAAVSSEVKLCDICGAVGYDEFLTVCTQCNERVEHVYCMQAICDPVPSNWVCEGCQKRLYNEIHEEKKERLLLKIKCKNQNIQTPFLSQETKLQIEQCMDGQERKEVKKQVPPIHGLETEEVRDGTLPKIVPSEGFAVSAEGALQASAVDVKAGCGMVGCEIASSQDSVDSKKFHHGLKGLASSKLRLCANHGLSKSNLSDSDPLLSFLLPSRPKELLRSNIRLSSVVANKKAGLPPNHVKVTVEAHTEHVGKEASLSASRSGIENSCQLSCRNFSHKSQGGMTVEAGWKCGHMNSSEVSLQSKSLSGNQKDMSCIEAPKAIQHAREKEAGVMEKNSLGKTAFFESNQLVPDMRKSFEMVHPGTVEKPLNISKKGILEISKLPPHGLLAVQSNVSSGTPRYHAPRPPVSQGGSHALTVSNEWQLQHRFDQPSVRPCRPYGQEEFMPLPQNIVYGYEMNVSNGYCVPPQLQAIPHVQKVWRGCFNVSTSASSSVVYNGMQAHPSNKADPKVWTAAQSLPGLLKMTELKRGLDNNTWPQHFLGSPPTSDNIGLFFFPVNMESHDSWYKPLAERLIAHDLVLRAESASLYLLIFHSQLLPSAEQLWDRRHYLWGVFRTKKSNSIQRATVVQSAVDANKSVSLNANGEIVDMDIDMVGGTDVQPSTALGREPSLPPLPPGSPPAEPPPPPTPPHHSDEDTDASFCSKDLPSAPPSPPPTPPQSQQEIILESSCDLSAFSKHQPAAQQGVCSTSNPLKNLLGGGNKRPPPDLENGIPFAKKSRSEDNQPEQLSLHDCVTPTTGESIQPFLPTSDGRKLEEKFKVRTNPVLQHHPT